jgi:DNA polymerase III delta prime subunit
MKKFEHFLWVEKYRPKKIEDCILPEMLKMQFKKFVESESIPNLIFSGPPGTGKTTVALAMIDEIGADSYMINASLYGNIETLRNELEVFASSVSTNGKRKYVVLDESDKTSIAFQEGLRAFIEEYSKNTGFILTCNYKTRLIEAIHSRCPSVDFNIPKTEIKEVMKQSFIRMANILTTENIKFDKPILLDVIKKFFQDMRRVFGELQK